LILQQNLQKRGPKKEQENPRNPEANPICRKPKNDKKMTRKISTAIDFTTKHAKKRSKNEVRKP